MIFGSYVNNKRQYNQLNVYFQCPFRSADTTFATFTRGALSRLATRTCWQTNNEGCNEDPYPYDVSTIIIETCRLLISYLNGTKSVHNIRTTNWSRLKLSFLVHVFEFLCRMSEYFTKWKNEANIFLQRYEWIHSLIGRTNVKFKR